MTDHEPRHEMLFRLQAQHITIPVLYGLCPKCDAAIRTNNRTEIEKFAKGQKLKFDCPNPECGVKLKARKAMIIEPNAGGLVHGR